MKKKVIIYVTAIILVLILCILACLPNMKKTYKIFISNIDYGNLQDLKEYNKDNDYEIKSIYETLSFTIGEERMAYHLVSVEGFEELNYHNWFEEDRSDFKLLNGSFPKNDSEIIIPNAFNGKYKIGDSILLNMGKVYGTMSNGEKLLAEKSLNNFVEGSLEYENPENKKEFTVVGFYDSEDNESVVKFQNGSLNLPYKENDVLYLEVPFFTLSAGFDSTDNVHAVVAYKALKEKELWKDEYIFLKRYISNYGFELPSIESLD